VRRARGDHDDHIDFDARAGGDRNLRQRQAARRVDVSRRRMIMNDCVKNPTKFAPCLAAATTVAQMEQECVIPLDDEGTEGEAAK
jgi:hypothetical protein